MILDRRAEEPTALYEGISCQSAEGAIRSAAPAIGKARSLQAADAALEGGYISQAERDGIIRELA